MVTPKRRTKNDRNSVFQFLIGRMVTLFQFITLFQFSKSVFITLNFAENPYFVKGFFVVDPLGFSPY